MRSSCIGPESQIPWGSWAPCGSSKDWEKKWLRGGRDRVEELTGVDGSCTRFLRYHADNDDSHMDKLYGLIDRVCTHEHAADDVVRTARVVGRLYALQLEEIDVEP